MTHSIQTIISLPQHNNFCVKRHFFLEISEWQHSVPNIENVFGWHAPISIRTTNWWLAKLSLVPQRELWFNNLFTIRLVWDVKYVNKISDASHMTPSLQKNLEMGHLKQTDRLRLVETDVRKINISRWKHYR